MKFKKKVIIVSIMLIILLILVGAWFLISSSYFNKDTEKKFDVNPLFFKAVIEENSSIVNNLQITNIDSVLRHFLIQLDNMDGLVTLNQLEFDLESNEIKEIQISFNSINKKPGIYLGELEIFSGDKTQHIQIVLEVQTKEVLFDGNLNLFSSDGEIIPGQKLNTEIKIFDLVNIGRSNIELEYFIKTCDGERVVLESEDLVIDGKLDYSKSLDIPENTKLGRYVLGVVITYDGSVGTASTFFNIVKIDKKQSSENLTLTVVLIFGFFFLIFLGLFVYSLFYRDKLLRDLQKQYFREMKKQREIIMQREKIDYRGLKTLVEKKEYKKEVGKVKKERLSAIKKVHKEKVAEYKKIKKIKNKTQMNSQLENWKKQGYNTKVLENKYKIPSISSVRRKINQWKKQGYDTRVLEKKKK